MFHCDDCQHWFETPHVISHEEYWDDAETDWIEELIDRRECPKCGSIKISYHEIP